jgi:DNA modification methylase
MAPISYLETDVLICDDNLPALAQFPSDCIDLVYLDPPFFSNRRYEVIWGDEAEMRSFRDRWRGSIQHYLDWMRPRVSELYRVLKPEGSLYLHCDPHASHYLKVMLDGIFGMNRFQNEIAWKRFSAKNDPNRFGRSHDLIFFYSKGASPTWNVQYAPFEEDYVKENYRYVEAETGRRYRRDNLTAAKPGGDVSYEWHGARPYKGRYWAYSRAKMDEMLASGRIEFRRTGMPVYKRYLDEQAGVPLQDVWTDIRLHSGSRERVGYPTQKPEALLERIIAASSNEGDIVLDPFCGCGTTIAVAAKMSRRWIGMDISPTAMRVMRRRMHGDRIYDFRIVGMPESEDDLRALEHFEFQNWVIDQLHGKHSPRKSGDMGIDGYSFFEMLPIQVKQSERVGREKVDEFQSAVRRDGSNKGFIVAFSFTKGAIDEVARLKNDGIEIGLVRVADILDNPLDRPLRANLPSLTRELLELARDAAAKAVYRPEAPSRNAEELAASIEGRAKPAADIS